MPTFTGVCNCGEIVNRLTELTNSTGYFSSSSSVSTAGALRLVANFRYGPIDISSQTWPSNPQPILVAIRVTGGLSISGVTSCIGYVYGWNGSTWVEIARKDLYYGSYYDEWINTSSFGVTQIKTRIIASADLLDVSIDVPEVVVSNSNVPFAINAIYYNVGSMYLGANYKPYTVFNSFWPVQYILKVESDHVLLAVQGAYQIDSSARTHIAYIGRLGTPPNAPPAYVAASTMGSANLTATLSDNRRANIQSTYNVYPHSTFILPDIQNRFALVPIYVYRSDENWRGWFKDLYVAQIPPQTMLNGETVTAQDGSMYTFFNIPPSGDGYYNNFLASGDTDKWLVIKH